MSILTMHCWWVDETAREMTGHLSSYAEAKKMMSLAGHIHGCLVAALRDCSSSSYLPHPTSSDRSPPQSSSPSHIQILRIHLLLVVHLNSFGSHDTLSSDQRLRITTDDVTKYYLMTSQGIN